MMCSARAAENSVNFDLRILSPMSASEQKRSCTPTNHSPLVDEPYLPEPSSIATFRAYQEGKLIQFEIAEQVAAEQA
jgi:hypothetical protein